MRAMSLVSNEGEGEQNEIRILQDKLNSTMKLVSHLTAQLNELKDQVCTQADPGPTLGVLRWVAPDCHWEVTAQPAMGERGRRLGPSCPFLSFAGLGWKTASKYTLSPVESQTEVGSPRLQPLKDMAKWTFPTGVRGPPPRTLP